ncbi:MAG: hypothetical protein QOD07_2696 [Frankiaceae bacterium]|jgi:hypothetical protein|nr:hypothetical protein [Frankiaceae bacterium]
MPETRVEAISVPDLLRMVEQGQLALPEFQRDFVWSDEQVVSLLVTVLKGWPAGTLLFTEAPTNEYLAMRQFDHGPPIQRQLVTHLVLDGQQRITGLYEALTRRSGKIWVIDARAVSLDADPEDLHDAIRSFSSRQWDSIATAPWSEERPYVPLPALVTSEAFFDWRNDVVARTTSEPQAAEDLAVRITQMYKEGLDTVSRYQFPLSLIDKNMAAESVARIFERINTSGLALSTFDLVVAHTYTETWNLRQAWDLELERWPLLEWFFQADGMVAVETLALVETGQVRRERVLGLPPGIIRDNFSRAAASLSRALEFTSSECGVADAVRLPHRGFLLVLAAVAWDAPLDKHIPLLRAWFFSRAFEQRYDAAVNTRIASDYSELRAAVTTRATLPRVQLAREQLSRADRRSTSARYRAFLALLTASGATDLPEGMFVLDTPPADLAPVNVLDRGVDSARTRAMGYLLLPRHRREHIDGIGPRVLYELLNRASPMIDVRDYLRRQLLPPLELRYYDDDDAFVEARAEMVLAVLSDLVGYDIT